MQYPPERDVFRALFKVTQNSSNIARWKKILSCKQKHHTKEICIKDLHLATGYLIPIKGIWLESGSRIQGIFCFGFLRFFPMNLGLFHGSWLKLIARIYGSHLLFKKHNNIPKKHVHIFTVPIPMKFHNQPLEKKKHRSIAKDHSAAASFLTKQQLDSSSECCHLEGWYLPRILYLFSESMLYLYVFSTYIPFRSLNVWKKYKSENMWGGNSTNI